MIHTVEECLAAFPRKPLTKINGEPTYTFLNILHEECIRNAAAIPTSLGGGSHGHAGLIEFRDAYLIKTGFHFNMPAFPGDQPTYTIGAIMQDQRALELQQWTTIYKAYKACQSVCSALLTFLIEAAIELTWLSGIYDTAYGFGTRTLLDIFSWLFVSYGKIGPNDLLENQNRLNQPIAPPEQPILVLFHQVDDAAKYAAQGDSAMIPTQVLAATENLVIQTGRYQYGYRKWVFLCAPGCFL